jgi:hypothetical protein
MYGEWVYELDYVMRDGGYDLWSVNLGYGKGRGEASSGANTGMWYVN